MTHVVAFGLKPIEGLFRTVRAISWNRVRFAVLWIGAAATRDLRSGEGNSGRRIRNITSESVHVIYQENISHYGEAMF